MAYFNNWLTAADGVRQSLHESFPLPHVSQPQYILVYTINEQYGVVHAICKVASPRLHIDEAAKHRGARQNINANKIIK